MEVKAFLITFEKTLINNGFSSEEARSHTLKIAKSLKDTDKQRIHNMTDTDAIVTMANNYSVRINSLLRNQSINKSDPDTMTISKQFSDSSDQYADTTDYPERPVREERPHSSEPDEEDEDIIVAKSPSEKKASVKADKKAAKHTQGSTQKIEVVTKQKPVPLTRSGKEKYRKWVFSNGIGLWIAVFLAALGIFIVYLLIALLIAALVGVLLGIVAIGCVATLSGLIYGVIMLFSVVPEGLYEIGLALVIFGITLAASIGVYNLAVRVTPLLWKRFTQYVKGRKAALRAYINKVRTECNGE